MCSLAWTVALKGHGGQARLCCIIVAIAAAADHVSGCFPLCRSAQDVVGSKVINQASGSAQLPGLLMGGASVAMT